MVRKTASGGESAARNHSFSAYGVRIDLGSRDAALLEKVAARAVSLFPGGVEPAAAGQVRFVFDIRRDPGGVLSLYRNGEKITHGDNETHFFNYLETLVRLTVAEHAVERVFVHAGVVGWKGSAIVLPASSFQGKTTLVRELLRLGAVYYSDEYAVLDEDGRVHPFAKHLSVRGTPGERRQTDVPVEHFGGTAGSGPLPVGLVVLTEFRPRARWNPEVLSVGQGVLEMLSHTIPITYNPKFALRVLNNTAKRAIILKAKRGEAGRFARRLLGILESRSE